MVMQKKRKKISSKRKKESTTSSKSSTDIDSYLHALKYGVYGKYNAIFSAFKLIESYGVQPIVLDEDYEIDARMRVHTNSIQIGYQSSHDEISKEAIDLVYDEDSKKWMWPRIDTIDLNASEINLLPFFKELRIRKKQE